MALLVSDELYVQNFYIYIYNVFSFGLYIRRMFSFMKFFINMKRLLLYSVANPSTGNLQAREVLELG